MSGASPVQRDSLVEEKPLPVLPPGLPYLLSALGDKDIDFTALTAVVQRFPSIAGRLLALANSAWVTPLRPITSLRDTCTLLGLGVVRSVCIALAVAKPFDPRRCVGFDVVRYWFSAFLTAEGAALLSLHCGEGRDADTLRTAGLLHNLGLLWLAEVRPVQTAEAFQAVAVSPGLCLMQAQQAAGGTDYCEAGGLLGEAWGLPGALTTVMRHHRSPEYRGPHERLAATCGIAASMAAALWRGMDQMPDELGAYPLGIQPSAMATLYRQIAVKRESIHELARALFGSLIHD